MKPSPGTCEISRNKQIRGGFGETALPPTRGYALLLINIIMAFAWASASNAADLLELQAVSDFQISKKEGFVPAYRDNNNRALAIDASRHKDQFAAGEVRFTGPSGVYDVVLVALTETDGESSYRLTVQGRAIGEFQNPPASEDYEAVQHRWKNVQVNNADAILLAFNTHSNKRTPEGAGFAFSRGRWRTLAFVAPGTEYAEKSEALPDKETSGYFQFTFDPRKADRVFEEQNGAVVVEAEHFAAQSADSIRKWYLISKTHAPERLRDPDGNHAEGASGGAYIEILPDTRKNHSEPLIQNENFSEDPGRLAVLYYPVLIHTPGRYYVWARSCPTGSEDNGLHVGLDGKWPASGMRMQWISKNSAWHWDSKQRTEQVHTGVKYRAYLDVKEPGHHTIMFSMREDGFEMDKWLMSTNKDILVHGDTSPGPVESPIRKPAQ